MEVKKKFVYCYNIESTQFLRHCIYSNCMDTARTYYTCTQIYPLFRLLIPDRTFSSVKWDLLALRILRAVFEHWCTRCPPSPLELENHVRSEIKSLYTLRVPKAAQTLKVKIRQIQNSLHVRLKYSCSVEDFFFPAAGIVNWFSKFHLNLRKPFKYCIISYITYYILYSYSSLFCSHWITMLLFAFRGWKLNT